MVSKNAEFYAYSESEDEIEKKCTNRKKHVATQVDFVRRIQPKRNVFKPTSYKDLDDPVISKRTRSIDSSDTGEEDTGSKRRRR